MDEDLTSISREQLIDEVRMRAKATSLLSTNASSQPDFNRYKAATKPPHPVE